jgi:hypothetical protein
MREGLAQGFAKNLGLPYAEAYDKMIQSGACTKALEARPGCAVVRREAGVACSACPLD